MDPIGLTIQTQMERHRVGARRTKGHGAVLPEFRYPARVAAGGGYAATEAVVSQCGFLTVPSKLTPVL